MTDATQQGVSKTPEQLKEEQEAVVKEVRQETIKERVGEVQDLAEMHKARRTADLSEQPTGEETDQVTFDSDKDKPGDKDLSTGNAQQKFDTSQGNDDDIETLIVDGVETAFPRSKVLDAGKRTLQKDYAADQRLEEATRILNEAKATADNLTKTASQPPSSQQGVDDASASAEIDSHELAKTLVDGDVDQVAETLDKLGIGRQEATQVQKMDPNQVYGLVESALQMKDAMDLFQRDPESGGYSDLYADETMRQQVFDKEKVLSEESNPKPPAERLKIAAQEVRDWRNSLIEKAGGSVVNFDTRKDQKANAKSTPETGGGRPAPEDDVRPVSQADKRREALAKMARSRGQHID